jgi:hypothetical protein
VVGDEPSPIAMISTTTTTMKASPATVATHRAPNRERLEGGTDVKLPAGFQTGVRPLERAMCLRDTSLGAAPVLV